MIINNFQFLIFNMWKETEKPQGIGLWSPVGFDYITPTGLGKQTLGRCKQNLVHTRAQEKGAVTPTRDWIRLACECQESLVEVWVDSSLLQGRGTEYKSFWRRMPLLSTPTIVWPQARQQGENTAPPINRKLD